MHVHSRLNLKLDHAHILYRWKRKGLLPEAWFIHKSAFTGQETFLTKQQILKRIDKILKMKDGKADIVRGKRVTIGPGCEIGMVEYSADYTKSKGAVVKEFRKV